MELQNEYSGQHTDPKPNDIASVFGAKVSNVILKHRQQFRAVLGFVNNTIGYGRGRPSSSVSSVP